MPDDALFKHFCAKDRWHKRKALMIFSTPNPPRILLINTDSMKATLVIVSEDGKTSLVYRNLDQPKPTVEAFDISRLPGLYFVDESAESAERIGKALGLTYSPKQFIGFFPPDIEEELANKEQGYRGRKAADIFSTTFKVLIRDGKPVIAVTEQKGVRQ